MRRWVAAERVADWAAVVVAVGVPVVVVVAVVVMVSSSVGVCPCVERQRAVSTPTEKKLERDLSAGW
jgi:hypothetical protein